MKPEQVAQALAKFPSETIEYLPSGGIQLAYLSHSWVTQRLLEIDPDWTWEPVAFDTDGLPKFDENGGLWIRLTVSGVTRYGYGEPQGRDAYDKRKGAIGNALRVAAMRFGIGLYLWQLQPGQTPGMPLVKGKQPAKDSRFSATMPASDSQRAKIRVLFDRLEIEQDLRQAFLKDVLKREITALNDLTQQEANLVITTLEAMGVKHD